MEFVRDLLYGPRARRMYYMVGTVLAVGMVVGCVIWSGVAISEGRTGQTLIAVLLGLGAVGFVVLAHRRANALVAAEEKETVARGEAGFERWARTGQSAFVARIKLRVYAVASVFACGGIALAAWALDKAAWPMAAVSGAIGLAMAFLLQFYLRHCDALVIDARGVDDRLRYGHIPWSEIKGAVLSVSQYRGARMFELCLEVPDTGPYRARLGPLARFFTWGMTARGTRLRLPLNMLDHDPQTVLTALRRFHARMAQPGSMYGTDAWYRVDPKWATLRGPDGALVNAKAYPGETRVSLEDPLCSCDPDKLAALDQALEANLAESRRLGLDVTEDEAWLARRKQGAARRRKVERRALLIVSAAILAVVTIALSRVLGYWD